MHILKQGLLAASLLTASAAALASSCDNTPLHFTNGTGHDLEIVEISSHNTELNGPAEGQDFGVDAMLTWVASSTEGTRGSASGKVVFKDTTTGSYHAYIYKLSANKFSKGCTVSSFFYHNNLQDRVSYSDNGTDSLDINVIIND